PFDVDEMADGLFAALTMPAPEQERRMRRMRAQVDDHNIYRWAGTLLSEVGKRVPDPLPATQETEEDADPEQSGRADAVEERIARENYLTAMHLAGAGV
ncbi:MAG: trehalose-6-phosphate synthase, partial [Planctomycetes bacterium]|nr:trehalose-6-phosphate synthase [Planctomycetota bacterium]